MAVGAVVARIITQYSDKGSKAANKDIAKLGKQFDAFAKKSAKAFGIAAVAVGALAVKLGTDAVKGAMEDQKQQVALAQALRNTVNASDAVIASTVKYLDKLELQVGVNNSELIPSLQKLTQATGSLEQAQSLQALALDVSAGTGKSLITVTDAIVRAIGGNIGALKKLGITLDEAIIKNKDLGGALEALSKTFGGQAAARANTFEFRMLRLRLAFDQTLDSLGYALLPVIEKFADTIQKKVLPRIEKFIKQNKEGLVKGLEKAVEVGIKLISTLLAFSDWISKNLDLVKALAITIAALWVTSKIATFIIALQGVATAFGLITIGANGATIATARFYKAAGFLLKFGKLLLGVLAILNLTGSAAKGAGGFPAGTVGARNAEENAARMREEKSYMKFLKGRAKEAAGTNILPSNLTGNLDALLAKLTGAQNKLNNAKKKELSIEQQIINKMLKKYGLTLMTAEIEAEATANAIKKNLNRQERIANAPTVSLAAQGDGSATGSSILGSGTPNISVSITTPHGTADDYVVDITNRQNTLRRRGGTLLSARAE